MPLICLLVLCDSLIHATSQRGDQCGVEGTERNGQGKNKGTEGHGINISLRLCQICELKKIITKLNLTFFVFVFLNPWLEQAKQRREILKEKRKKKATLSREQGQRSTVGHSREV